MEGKENHDTLRPTMHVTLFGSFTLKRLVPSATWEPVTSGEWEKRGTARRLLQFLLCRPNRFALKDQVLEAIWPDREVDKAERCLHVATSVLRDALETYTGECLLTTTRGHDASFKLAPQRRLWVDIDAFEWYIAQAVQMGRSEEEALTLWEKAYALARGKTFLPENLYSIWTEEPRRRLEGKYHLCIRQLAHLYARRGRGQEAIVLLHTSWVAHPIDQDMLCLLMRLLTQEQGYEEALRLYAYAEQVLWEEGVELAPPTRALIEQIRANAMSLGGDLLPPRLTQTDPELQVHLDIPLGNEAAGILTQTTNEAGDSSFAQVGGSDVLSDLPPQIPQPTTLIRSPHMVQSLQAQQASGLSMDCMFVPATPSMQMIPVDIVSVGSTLWFVLKQHQWEELAGQYSGQVLLCDKLQTQLRQEFDAVKSQSYDQDYTISRRQAIGAIAALPVSLLTKIHKARTKLVPEEFLPMCAASNAACRSLINSNGLQIVEQVLPMYLPTLKTLAQHPSRYQKVAAQLISQSYRLAATLAHHRHDLTAQETYCQLAVVYSRLVEDHNELLIALSHAADDLYYRNRAQDMLPILQEAQLYMDGVSPLLQSSVYMKQAAVLARHREEQEALRALGLARDTFPERPEEDPTFPFASGLPWLIVWEGLTHLELGEHDPGSGHYQAAERAFAQIQTVPATTVVPERIRAEITNHRTLVAVKVGDMEAFRKYLIAGVEGAEALGSQKRRQEAIANWHAARKIWPHERQVLELADLFV